MSILDLDLIEPFPMLIESLSRYLRDGDEKPTWTGLANDIGLMSVGVGEASGGGGGGMAERGAVMAALAPSLAGADWLPHALATGLIAMLAPDHALLPALIDGSQRIALIATDVPGGVGVTVRRDGAGVRVSGDAVLVAGAADADWLLIADEGGIVLVAAGEAGVVRHAQTMRDATRSADCSFAVAANGDALIASDGVASTHAAEVALELLAGRCAEACGLMQRMLTDTAEYLNQRQQFGTPIARFQVLRHRMADMQMAYLKAAALTEAALVALDSTGNAERAVSAACVEVIDAARIVGEGAVQLHGAMGLTEELKLGGHYKRALAITAGLGSTAAHLARHSRSVAAAA